MGITDVIFMLYYMLVVLIWILIITLIRNTINKSSNTSTSINLTITDYEHHNQYGLVIGITEWDSQCKINDPKNNNEDVIRSYLQEYVQIGYTTFYKGICFLRLTERIDYVKKI